jgi:hypothetical protein
MPTLKMTREMFTETLKNFQHPIRLIPQSNSETSVSYYYQPTRRYNPDDSHLHTGRRENLTSYHNPEPLYEHMTCPKGGRSATTSGSFTFGSVRNTFMAVLKTGRLVGTDKHRTFPVI